MGSGACICKVDKVHLSMISDFWQGLHASYTSARDGVVARTGCWAENCCN